MFLTCLSSLMRLSRVFWVEAGTGEEEASASLRDNQSFNQSIIQLINQSIIQLIIQLIIQSINRSFS